MKTTITREEAWALLEEHGASDNHLRHMLSFLSRRGLLRDVIQTLGGRFLR